MVLLRIIERKTEISHAKNPWNVATDTDALSWCGANPMY
jgi:hypothetical protein